MQQQIRGFFEAEVRFISSFYSIAAMDGQTAEHLQQIISKYTKDEILTVMWVLLTLIAFLFITFFLYILFTIPLNGIISYFFHTIFTN